MAVCCYGLEYIAAMFPNGDLYQLVATHYYLSLEKNFVKFFTKKLRLSKRKYSSCQPAK